jgi:uncharacterized protein YbaA (DUF1428 family)
MTYVDGFVLVVPRIWVAKYHNLEQDSGRIWMKHGALDFKEWLLDDAKPKFVTFTFPKMAKVKKGYCLVFIHRLSIKETSQQAKCQSMERCVLNRV